MVTEPRRIETREAVESRAAFLSYWQLCDDLGASLTLATWGDKVVVCLPSGITEAFIERAAVVEVQYYPFSTWLH